MMRNEGGRAWDGKINDDGKTKEENSNFHISSVSSRERVRVAKKFLTMKFAGSDEKDSALLCEKRISKFHCEPLRLMPKKKILCCCFTLPWRRENLRNPPLLRLDSHLHKVNYILMFLYALARAWNYLMSQCESIFGLDRKPIFSLLFFFLNFASHLFSFFRWALPAAAVLRVWSSRKSVRWLLWKMSDFLQFVSNRFSLALSHTPQHAQWETSWKFTDSKTIFLEEFMVRWTSRRR